MTAEVELRYVGDGALHIELGFATGVMSGVDSDGEGGDRDSSEFADRICASASRASAATATPSCPSSR